MTVCVNESLPHIQHEQNQQHQQNNMIRLEAHDDDDLTSSDDDDDTPFHDGYGNVVKSTDVSDTDDMMVALNRLLITSKVALKVNWKPALVLNGIALVILLLFFSVQSVNDFFTSLADLKDRVGIPFGIISTSIAAGVIPSIFMAVNHAIQNKRLRESGKPIPVRVPRIEYEALFLIIYWGYRGLEADLFYRLQAIMIGDSGSAGEVILKVMVDMFVYNPCFACQQVLVFYFWKDANFTVKPAYDKYMSREFWVFILPSALLTTWIVWTPACGIIYALPAGLQLIMMNIVCCFWSILLQIVTKADQIDNTTDQSIDQPISQSISQSDEYDIDDDMSESDDDDHHSQPSSLQRYHMPHEDVVTQAETIV